jgi:tripartite-type tricarboxylate transporter receptor subunit TctC
VETDFYSGRTIRVVVGARPGVAYDLYARLIAGHLAKYIPGAPEIVVENAIGKNSRAVANDIYGACADGLTLAAIAPALYFDQILGHKDAAFDWRAFSWIGTPDRSAHLLYARTAMPYDSLGAIVGAAIPPRCGAAGAASTAYHLPKLLGEIFGARFQSITDYREGPDVDAAVERGEIDCRVLTISGFFSHEPYPTWRRTGFVRILLQTGAARDSRLPETPTIYELMDERGVAEPGRRLARVVLSAERFGRPWVAPPGVPAELMNILRAAFARAARDPALLAEAEMKDLSVAAGGGEELQVLAREVAAQPPEIIARLRKLFDA